MSSDRLAEEELDRLGAAVFEQRRLSHMLRGRGSEIEALQAERERLVEKERKGRERLSSLTSDRDRLTAELTKVKEDRERGEAQIEKAAAERKSLHEERDGLRAELKQAQYEARRAERRVEKTDRDATEARARTEAQLEKAAAERKSLHEERDGLRAELKRAQHEARLRAEESVRLLEEGQARELGEANREIELLIERETERQALLADSDRALAEVAEQLRRTRVSRSWRWGHATAQALRAITFRRRSSAGALDVALARLDEHAGDEARRDEPGPA